MQRHVDTEPAAASHSAAPDPSESTSRFPRRPLEVARAVNNRLLPCQHHNRPPGTKVPRTQPAHGPNKPPQPFHLTPKPEPNHHTRNNPNKNNPEPNPAHATQP
jgi:hypothetical protein